MSVPSSAASFLFTSFFVFFTLTETTSSCLAKIAKTTRPHRQLSVEYYAKSCPQVEQLVGSVTSQQFKESPVSAPATIRLLFHDCFVGGCDASILISTKPGSKELAEKDAEVNKDLRVEGFETIRKAKALVESKCPGVVSCADILVIAARDYVHLAGGPYYQVKKGRWDGKISMASRVGHNIPRANSTVDHMIKLFNSKGLTIKDMVALSGAHTFGFAHCRHFVTRLYNYRGTGQPDPDMKPRLIHALRLYCPRYGGNLDIVTPFDVTTPFLFDHAYYGNLEKKLGLLASDQALFLDPRTKPLVQALAQDKHQFSQAFAVTGCYRKHAAHSSLMAESLAIRDGIVLVASLSLEKVLLETDNLEVVQAWTGRQGNELAHHITALARTNRLSPNWTYNIPSSVKAILQQDRIGIRNERLKGDDCLSAVLRCDVTGAVDG